jgi:hypothetical protein
MQITINKPETVRAQFRLMRGIVAVISLAMIGIFGLEFGLLRGAGYTDSFYISVALFNDACIILLLGLVWGIVRFVAQPWFEVAVLWKRNTEHMERLFNVKSTEAEELRDALSRQRQLSHQDDPPLGQRH